MSFGDYFKEEIIGWSYEILTKVYKLKEEDLYVTIFEGNKDENLEKDNEAFNFWSEIIDKDKIILEIKKIIFGKWAILDLVDLAQKFILI